MNGSALLTVGSSQEALLAAHLVPSQTELMLDLKGSGHGAEYVEMTSQLSQQERGRELLRLGVRGLITDNLLRLARFLPVTTS